VRYILYDAETRSTASLPQVGSHVYTSDPTTDVWCVSYCTVTDGARGPIATWLPSDPVPAEILTAAADPETLIVAHNDAFERQVEERILHPRYSWPIFPLERRRCAMTMALASALPASPEGAAEALGLPVRKDAEGARLMRLMSRPRKPRKNEDPTGVYWHDDPEKLERLYAYCRNDVEVEHRLFERLGPLIADEQLLWQLDARINSAGFFTDGALLEAASRIAAAADQAAQDELARITNGALTSTDQVAALQAWLAEHGCEVKDVRKSTLRHALRREDLNPAARRVIELRLGAAHAAAAKVDALLAWRGADGRVRGTLRFHGAGTGRWTGHGPQPQNFKRDGDGIEAKCQAIATGDLAHVAGLYPQPLETVGDIARAMICAAPGHRLIIGDLSGVESRITAWVSDQRSKLEQWDKFDHTGKLEDEPYYLIGRACGRPEETARAIGKTADLAFGYMGGPGAWDRLAGEDDTSTEEDKRRYQRTWRNMHQQTVQFWGGINRAAINAVRKPGTTVAYKKFTLNDNGTFLRIVLPSGPSLSYPFPRLGTDKFNNLTVLFKDNAGGKFTDCRFGQGAYGGLWTENVVQAIARDLLAAAVLRLETAGYSIVLHVHDEIVAEVPNGIGSVDELQRIITTVPRWAEGLPIAAKVRNGPRFAKAETAPTTEPEVDADEAGEVPPITQADIDEINAGLKREGIESLQFSAEAPPHPGDDPSPRDNKHDAGQRGDGYPHGERRRGRRVAAYLYRDHLKNPHTKIEKWVSPKTKRAQYPQSFWVESRRISEKPKSWQKIPYRLPEMLEALAKNPGADVFIPEGEKDADTLAALDLIATTNSEGATPLKAKIGKWTPELNKWFHGLQRRFILADNDDVGHAFAREKARALEGVVPDIRVVLFPDVPAGEDVTHWIRELGHTKEELLARCEAAESWQIADGTLDSVRADQVAMRAIRWLWRKRFAVGKIGIIAGLPDEGKGQILCYIAARITRALEWPNGEGRAPLGNVIVLSAEEDPSDSLAPRLEAAGADLDRIHFVNMVRDHDEKTGRERKRMFSLVSDLEKLRRKITEVATSLRC
jgi:DNA polymerase